MEKKNIEEKAQLKTEKIVLCVFSAYTIAMFVVAQLGEWSIFIKEVMIAAVMISWVVWVKRYGNHCFRAKFISVMAWVNLCMYALHTRNFLSMLSTMAGMIVLLGIFCIPWVIYLGVAIATGIFLYHGFVVRTLTLDSASNVIGTFLQILSIYTVSAITWIVIRTQQETRERLIENINDLEIAEQSKDDFVVNISHEIRTPINAVCGMSDAILQEELPAEVRRDIIDIQTAGRTLLSTVSNILDFSELESGKMELAEESYNITSTITDIINMALPLLNGRKLELIVDCDADLPGNLLGDEQKLRRIILNLLDNAFKFTKEGGVILRIKCRKEEYGTNLLISVKDSGIGMESEDMEKIFASFRQVNARRNREEGGIGLGLAITQALVYRMGGFITVNSTLGVGSCFQFTIPQKVLDETPIVSINHKQHLYVAFYINMDKYDYSIIRQGYGDCIRHISEQLGIMIRVSSNLQELKRRQEHDNYSHVFISWSEYCEDKNFFEQLARELTVVLILNYGQETQTASNMLRIYKPFTILSIAAVFNGRKTNEREGEYGVAGRGFVAPEAKVLVVDDNAMNLKVMARLLQPYQIKAVMASSGQEALDKLDSMDFDCVFLDHMMPEMDGVEVLHRIRMKPDVYYQSLSVIAFTANAIGGAREMFLSEGFDDFIAKPIELSVLERILRRYIPQKKQRATEQGTVGERKNSDKGENLHAMTCNHTGSGLDLEKSLWDYGLGEGGPADVSGEAGSEDAKALESLRYGGINIRQGITFCGDIGGLREIIRIFHGEGHKRKRQLQQLYQEQNWKDYVIAVHALKSNAKGIGADELAELAQRMELAGKEGCIEYILDNHEELLRKHDILLKLLAANHFVYPEKQKDFMQGNMMGERISGGLGTEKIVNEAFESDQGYEELEANQTMENDKQIKENEITLPELEKWMEQIQKKLDEFESEGLDILLKEAEKQRYHGERLSKLTDAIKDKVSEFDFIGAAHVLTVWKKEYLREG